MIETNISVVVGPVLARAGGYVYETWTADEGLCGSFVYPRIDNAYYARAVEIAHYRKQGALFPKICETVDEFAIEAAWEAEAA
jgi:hypothetical protein